MCVCACVAVCNERAKTPVVQCIELFEEIAENKEDYKKFYDAFG